MNIVILSFTLAHVVPAWLSFCERAQKQKFWRNVFVIYSYNYNKWGL